MVRAKLDITGLYVIYNPVVSFNLRCQSSIYDQNFLAFHLLLVVICIVVVLGHNRYQYFQLQFLLQSFVAFGRAIFYSEDVLPWISFIFVYYSSDKILLYSIAYSDQH